MQFSQGKHLRCYRAFKIECYLTILGNNDRIIFCGFIFKNHNLLCNTNIYNSNLDVNEKHLHLCKLDVIGDEFHLLFECSNLKAIERSIYLYTSDIIQMFSKWISFSTRDNLHSKGKKGSKGVLKAGMNPGFWWILDGLYLIKYWSK